ncbi:UbiA prenyltransferase family-domain-containing protein [Mycena capillaripes]|nr:UbiA prenyltransferase family-domain-containing protein [Mycena capillaripes]
MAQVSKHPKPGETLQSENRALSSLCVVQATILNELDVFWAFTWRDWSSTLIPGMMYTVAVFRRLPFPVSPSFIGLGIGRALIYLALYIYSFNLSNQIHGVTEDRINKPSRPLPSGRISLREAYFRWYATTVAFLVVGAAWGVGQWSLLWVLLTIAHNFGGFDKHWFTRNLVFISLGVIALLQPMWELLAPSSSTEWQWMLMLSGFSGILCNVQDFRDVEGDRAIGRHTLPLALGERDSRRVMAAFFSITPPIFWAVELISGYHVYWFGLSMLYIAYRILRGTSREYDHKTYIIFTCLYLCGLIGVHIVFQ